MQVKLNEQFQIKFLVINSAGQRVTTTSPVTQIIRDRDHYYWNGFDWQQGPINLAMTHFDSGVYVYPFTPAEKGSYTIHCDEFMYDVHDTFSIEVYDEADVGLYAVKGESFTFKFLVLDTSGQRVPGLNPTPTIQILDDESGNYFLGTSGSWSATPTSLSMTDYGDGLYTYTFTPDKSGYFTINCDEGVYNTHDTYSLKVVDFMDSYGTDPLLVSSETLHGPDGGSSYVVDKDGIAIQGVQVKAYDSDRKLVTKVTTFADGSWQMYLRPGKYIFMFEKEGYVSASMERVIL